MNNDSIIGLLVLVGLPAIFFGFGIWILRPIDLAGRLRRKKTKISIADFLSLFVAVQLPMSLLVTVPNEIYEADRYRLIILLLAWIVGPLIWWNVANALSRAGLASGWRRILLMGVVMPVVYYGLIPFSFAVIYCIIGTLVGEADFNLLNFRVALSLAVGLGCALLLCGVATRKIVDSLETEQLSIAEDKTN